MDTRLQVLDLFRLRLVLCVFLDTSLILAVVLQLLQVVCGGSNTCGNTFGLGLEPPCVWNEDVCSNAAYSGYLDVLKKEAFMKGLMMGFIQLVMFNVYALAFFIGGKFVAAGTIGFDEFFMALFGMAFAASGIGQAAIFAGDAAKAHTACENIFNTLDRIPTIDGEPWMNNGIATNDGKDPNVPKCAERYIPNLDANFEGNMV